MQRPHHAAVERWLIFRLFGFRRFGQFLNHGQGVLPGGRRGRERRERGGAQGGVVRPIADGALELRRRQPFQHGATFGGHPGEAVVLGSAPQHLQPFHVLRLRHFVQPAAAYASEQAREPVRPPVVVAQTALGLHLGGIERQLQAQVIRLAPPTGILDIRQQAFGGGRALPRQRQQRQREGPGFRKHQPLAVPAQRVQRFVDGCRRGAVVAPQHGDQGAGGGLADHAWDGVVHVCRQAVEHFQGGIESALQHADEGDVVHVLLRGLADGQAHVDQRIRRRADFDDARQAGLACRLAPCRWHGPQRFLGKRLRQQRGIRTPLLHTRLEPLAVARQQIAAHQQPGSAPIILVRLPPGADATGVIRLRIPALLPRRHGIQQQDERAFRPRLAHQRQGDIRDNRDRPVRPPLGHAGGG